ncbi:MAG: dTDP-4-dehydrorhamnose 3,5-epimerase family protein [bacterium]
MIRGVAVKHLKCIPDDRGFLMEMLRCDDGIYAGFGQVYLTGCKMGVVKGWHYHKMQTDHFVCVQGRALVVLYDTRRDSETYGTVEEYVMEAPPHSERPPFLLKIPPYVLHGFTALEGDEARIINIPTLPYNYKEPDEFRMSWDDKEIPYSWPPYVKRGG